MFGQMDLFVCSLIGHDRLNTEVGCSHCVQRVFDVDVSVVGGGDCQAWQWWMTWSFGSSGTHTSTQGGCPDTSQRWGMANKCSFYHCNLCHNHTLTLVAPLESHRSRFVQFLNLVFLHAP